jgi:hypothetical protein
LTAPPRRAELRQQERAVDPFDALRSNSLFAAVFDAEGLRTLSGRCA